MKIAAHNPAGKRLSVQAKLIVSGLLLMFGLVLLSAVVATTATREETQASEQCIMCHVQLFDAGQRQTFTHVPFFERQCTVCHLAPGTKMADIVPQGDNMITGSIVTQQDLWRKMQSFSSAASPSFDHLVSLPALKMDAAYRFRIVDSTAAKSAGGEVNTSLWLGLRPAEVTELGDTQQLDLTNGKPADSSGLIRSASLYRNGGTIYVTWETMELMYGWIELQELEGIDLNTTAPEMQNDQATAAADGHPPMRNPEDLAITVCYQCHPQVSLGTSHPVRLYGGRDVRIPEELPTVDGMLTCVTCHDPHGAPGEMLVRETIKTKLCVACHYKYKNSSPSTMFQ